MLTALGRRSDGGPQRGSAALLLPAGLLVVLVLGAIVVDLTVVHLAARQAGDAATAAANDAAAAALDLDGLRRDGTRRIDAAAATDAARRTVADHHLPHTVRAVDVRLGPGPQQVTVTVELSVDPILAGALPGGGPTTVRATGTATLRAR